MQVSKIGSLLQSGAEEIYRSLNARLASPVYYFGRINIKIQKNLANPSKTGKFHIFA